MIAGRFLYWWLGGGAVPLGVPGVPPAGDAFLWGADAFQWGADTFRWS